MESGTSAVPALSVRNLSKTFPGQRALNDVSFELRRGEVHALVGQNGSGKSTFIKILSGYHTPDSGATAEVGGQPFTLGDPKATLAAGLRFVHQDLALVPALDALDNLALGRGYVKGRTGTISWRREAASGKRLLRELGYSFDLRTPVSRLGASDRTGLAIARALQGWEEEARVLWLDEPTAASPAAEVQRLFEVVGMLKERGVAIGYVSHHFTEVFEICDRVTILRDGRLITTEEVADLDEPRLIELTVGRAVARLDRREDSEVHTPPSVTSGDEEVNVLSVRGLSGRVLTGIDFDVRAGEVVGIAGVTGSGRDEVPLALFGAIPREGEVAVAGRKLRAGDPATSVSRGMSLVPSDRAQLAALSDMSLRENVTIGMLGPYQGRFGLRRRAERIDAEDWLRRLEVNPPRQEVLLSRLSGGNQQKVMLARALRRNPKVLVLDEPTQGVDVGAKAAIHKIIDDVADGGAGVIVASSESEELVRLCHRIIVLAGGQIRTICNAKDVTADELTELGLGTATSPA